MNLNTRSDEVLIKIKLSYNEDLIVPATVEVMKALQRGVKVINRYYPAKNGLESRDVVYYDENDQVSIKVIQSSDIPTMSAEEHNEFYTAWYADPVELTTEE